MVSTTKLLLDRSTFFPNLFKSPGSEQIASPNPLLLAARNLDVEMVVQRIAASRTLFASIMLIFTIGGAPSVAWNRSAG